MTTRPRAITVVGGGYVGLVTAVGMATVGHDVTLIETAPQRLEMLQAGRIPIHEAGLQAALTNAIRDGRIRVVGQHDDSPLGLVMVCVGTPIDDFGQLDLSQMEGALTAIAPHATGSTVLVIRSTLPVGSTPFVREWSGIGTERTFTNPEFLRQGTAYADFLNPTRVVIGQFADADPDARAVVLAALEPIPGPRLIVGVAEAELIKNAANAFLGLRLSYVNELAALCEEYGADVEAVLEGVCLDPRIGRAYMRPSFGFGGSCLPKELLTLANAGHVRGLSMHVTTAASDANEALQVRFADRIERALSGVGGRRIALLGLAFKAETDDVRASPALGIARRFLERGAEVVAYDPAAAPNALRALPQLCVVDDPYAALAGADACVIATEWPEFRELDWTRARELMAGSLVADGRRMLDVQEMIDLGFTYLAVGRPDVKDPQPAAVDRSR
jgi:UDPglucose 6-dehydrogenase